MSFGSYNNSEFIEMIKEILIELDLPEVLKITKYNGEIENVEESYASTSYRASEEIDYRDFGSYFEENDENYISYECNDNYEEEYNNEENEEDYEIMLSSDLSFNSAYLLLNHLEKNGINVTIKKFRKHFDKWIKGYPKLKDLYKNVLSVNNFSKYETETKIKITINPSSKTGKIKKIIDDQKKEQERKLLKSLEKLRIK